MGVLSVGVAWQNVRKGKGKGGEGKGREEKRNGGSEKGKIREEEGRE